jgi:hypothetical protein
MVFSCRLSRLEWFKAALLSCLAWDDNACDAMKKVARKKFFAKVFCVEVL